DALGNLETEYVEVDIVDSVAPSTVKEILGPQENGDGSPIDKYITSESTIRLECTDPNPHPVDDVTLHWELYWSENCEGWGEPMDSGDVSGYQEFNGLSDSCHKLRYYCEDALGNSEELWQWEEVDAVDNVAPHTEKIVGYPQYPGTGNTDWWITQNTPIDLICNDPGPHPVNGEILYWRWKVDDGSWNGWYPDYDGYNRIWFGEDSNHTLEWYCEDALLNTEITQTEVDQVDTEGPVIEKWVEGGPYAQAFEEIEICANVYDIKQTLNPGVGVDPETVQSILTSNDDTENVDMNFTDPNLYCGTWETEMCGSWNLKVEAYDYLQNYNIENGVNIIVDTAPACMKVENPHAGGWYNDGEIFTVQGWTFDNGGDDQCIASGVETIEFYALDIGYDECAQEDINTSDDFIDCVHNLGGVPVYLGEINESHITGSEYMGLLRMPEESGFGLIDVVYMWYVITDRAGNVRVDFAKNWAHHPEEPCEDGTVISMNIDNEGPRVIISYIDGLENPVTSEDVVTVMADVEDFASQPLGCSANIYQYDDETPVLIFENIPGVLSGQYECTVTTEIPTTYLESSDALTSGEYMFEVVAWDSEFNYESDFVDFIIDNTRPTMSVVSPLEGEVYNAMFPVSLSLDDDTGIAAETVQFRIMEIPVIGNLFCLFEGSCEDTGWVELSQDNGLYTNTIDLVNYGISGQGRYVFDAVACDILYTPDETVPLGFVLDTRNQMHCRMITEHGADSQEPECGNDIIEGEEYCDDGIMNGEPSYCNIECTDYVEEVLDVKINEFLSDPIEFDERGESEDFEWIELYNPNSFSVDLTNWTIEDGTVSPYDLSGSILGFGYRVFTQGTHQDFLLDESGDTIVLKDDGSEIDRVAYGDWNGNDPNNNVDAPYGEESAGRYPDGFDTDVDNVDFCLMTPTEGSTNGNCLEGD
ncbi:lamin tail domain-containing protein, partial [archaeon]|nr:lamin tail domain-containing protein [archaeon]